MPSPATTQALIDSLGGLITVVQQLKGELGTLTAGAKQSGDGAKAGASAFASLTAMMGPVGEAVNVVKGSFDSLAGTLRPFVEAFSPSAVLVFDQAMRDLSAVIGSAVLPIFNVLTGVVREAGAILLPVFQQLQPVIQEVAVVLAKLAGNMFANVDLLVGPIKTLGGLFAQVFAALEPVFKRITTIGGLFISVLTPVVTIIGAVMSAWASAFGVLAEAVGVLTPVFEGLGVIMAGVNALLGAFFAELGGLFNFGLKDAIKSLGDAVVRCVEAIILAAARLAAFLRLDSFVQGMIAALGGDRQSAQGFAAPQGARVGTDIGGFDKELRALAVTGTVTGLQSEEERRHTQLLKALNDIADNTKKENASTGPPRPLWRQAMGVGLLGGPNGALFERIRRALESDNDRGGEGGDWG